MFWGVDVHWSPVIHPFVYFCDSCVPSVPQPLCLVWWEQKALVCTKPGLQGRGKIILQAPLSHEVRENTWKIIFLLLPELPEEAGKQNQKQQLALHSSEERWAAGASNISWFLCIFGISPRKKGPGGEKPREVVSTKLGVNKVKVNWKIGSSPLGFVSVFLWMNSHLKCSSSLWSQWEFYS